MDANEFELPDAITDLLTARNKLRERYLALGLTFTLDGNLVGDIGEAVAAELFGIKLTRRCGVGVDGHAPDGRTVQVKASGSNLGPAFRFIETRADHLLFFSFDFETCKGTVTFNGPEKIAIAMLPETWTNQRSVTLGGIRRANAVVSDADRLPLFRYDDLACHAPDKA
ncbi:hypothetical protein ASD79_10385 [Caulobacter sp. Root655]|uniref:DUF6998 domain-containing protein n=1 Tax=Caulobacter sp. Root655 TaxID=1736578 RepID=UPI0007010494|nr:hypothetical protein [Caulobacter sp. Root655]KRA59997.1 hypothetical protein ASD79_10385 [Caulobacter sp. Root655]